MKSRHTLAPYLAAAFGLSSGLVFFFWQSLILKGLLIASTLLPISTHKRYLPILAVVGCFPAAYAIAHRPSDLYQLRSLFFVCGVSVAITLLSNVPRFVRRTFRSNRSLLSYLVLTSFAGSCIAILAGETTLANNFTSVETDRFRGVVSEVILFALVVRSRNRWASLVFVVTGALALFLVTGGRGASAFFFVSAIFAILLSARRFWWFLAFQHILLYPLFLLVTGSFSELEGSFFVKASGIVTALDSITLVGNGIQPPASDVADDRISDSGVHFSAADYGFMGMVYELGVIAAVMRVCVFLVILRRLAGFRDTPQIKLVIYCLAPLILGYGIGVDFLAGVLSMLLLPVVTRATTHRGPDVA